MTLCTKPAPILHQPSNPVVAFDTDLSDLVDSMIETMTAANGVGLAAVQVGVPLRVYVARPARGSESVNVFINPHLHSAYGWYNPGEGCLSVPGLMLAPPRPRLIHLSWTDLSGASHTAWLDGFAAHVASHELDHLDGILLDDRYVLGPTQNS